MYHQDSVCQKLELYRFQFAKVIQEKLYRLFFGRIVGRLCHGSLTWCWTCWEWVRAAWRISRMPPTQPGAICVANCRLCTHDL